MVASFNWARWLEDQPVAASAPCRVDLGGTLDLSTFIYPLAHLSPCTFNMALSLRTRVQLLPWQAGELKISSTGFDSLTVAADKVSFLPPLGLMGAIATHYRLNGVHVHIESSSPPRAAMGGSSVAAVALIGAIAKVLQRAGLQAPDPLNMALLAHGIEQSVAGVPCGIQDHLAAAFGGVNAWYWRPAPGVQGFERRVLIPQDQYAALEQATLVAYCGVPHESADINGAWVRQFVAGRHRRVWRRIVAVSRDFAEAIGSGRYEEAAGLMNHETELRCRMTPDVLDSLGRQLVKIAARHGCGARFAGAGGGGCLWAVGPADSIRQLEKAWAALLAKRPHARLLDVCIDGQGVL